MTEATDLNRIARVLILGAGQAAAWAAHTLRAEGFTGEIIVVGREVHLPYERPYLSKGLLLGEQVPADGQIFGAVQWQELAVELRLGTEAVELDLHRQDATLANGSVIGWDRLLICTGGRARVLSDDAAEALQVRTIDDSIALREAFANAESVGIVGGGWIGLEVASAARAMGLAVTLIEQAPVLCERVLPHPASEWLEQLHRAQGVRLQLGAAPRSIVRDDRGYLLTFADGFVTEVNALVAGVGMVANDELAKEAGLACEGGIRVDSFCRTSHPHVFAAGDVAVAPNTLAGRPLRLESWQNAQEQGAVAARNMLGKVESYDPLPWFWSDQFGHRLQVAGMPRQADRCDYEKAGSKGHVWTCWQGERLCGAIGVDAAPELRSLKKRLQTSRHQALAA